MPRHTRQSLIWIAIFALALMLGSVQAIAQSPPHYSHKQLKLLIDKASNAADYQKLATYFHYQSLMFHAKAQQVLDESSRTSGRYPMATKTVSRAEVAKREYDDDSSKAAENENLAAHYDQMLTELGVKPVSQSATLVSVKTLRNDPGRTADSAFAQSPKK